jgi:hypothetical protein
MQPVLDPPVAPDGGRQRLRRDFGARDEVSDLGCTLPLPLTPRMVSTASTALMPGQAARVAKALTSGQANSRRRTRRPWLSSNASKQGRSGAPSAKALAANQALTSAWAFLWLPLSASR